MAVVRVATIKLPKIDKDVTKELEVVTNFINEAKYDGHLSVGVTIKSMPVVIALARELTKQGFTTNVAEAYVGLTLSVKW